MRQRMSNACFLYSFLYNHRNIESNICLPPVYLNITAVREQPTPSSIFQCTAQDMNNVIHLIYASQRNRSRGWSVSPLLLSVHKTRSEEYNPSFISASETLNKEGYHATPDHSICAQHKIQNDITANPSLYLCMPQDQNDFIPLSVQHEIIEIYMPLPVCSICATVHYTNNVIHLINASQRNRSRGWSESPLLLSVHKTRSEEYNPSFPSASAI